MSLARKRPASTRQVRPQVEALESRLVPYALSGYSWPSPQLVTISFVPDGTTVGSNGTGPVYSNMFAQMNKIFGSPSVWEGIILKAAQSWADQTNLNFAVVSDNGTAIGQGAYQQGDPNMGDIRIGGYAFSQSYLGQAYMPPPANNYSIAGDVQLNTGVSWKNTKGQGTYDLFSVAAHEIGHALGLYHSTTTTAVMYSTYNGVKSALTSDDVAGIEAIYSGGSARSQDAYNSNGASNGTLATAADVSSLIDPNALTALVQNLQIDSPTQAEYFTFTAPANTSTNLAVTVQSTGLSLFTPSLTVYDSDGSTVLGTQTSAGNQDGATLTVNVSTVTPNHQYYVKVTGADSTAFSSGTYALTLNLGTGAAPTVPLPNTTLLNGSPIHGGGGQGLQAGNPDLGLIRKTAQQTGFTLQGIAAMSADEADAYSATAAGDSNLDQVLAQIAALNNGGSSNKGGHPGPSLPPAGPGDGLPPLPPSPFGQLPTLVGSTPPALPPSPANLPAFLSGGSLPNLPPFGPQENQPTGLTQTNPALSNHAGEPTWPDLVTTLFASQPAA